MLVSIRLDSLPIFHISHFKLIKNKLIKFLFVRYDKSVIKLYTSFWWESWRSTLEFALKTFVVSQSAADSYNRRVLGLPETFSDKPEIHVLFIRIRCTEFPHPAVGGSCRFSLRNPQPKSFLNRANNGDTGLIIFRFCKCQRSSGTSISVLLK